MNALIHDRLVRARPLPAPTDRRAPSLGPQPLIRTGRLTLRPVERRDAPAIRDALGNYRVAKMLARAPQPYHLEDAEDWLEDIAANRAGQWIFAITLGGVRAMLAPTTAAANGNVAGTLVGLVAVEWRKTGAREGWHIGYWLNEQQWGRGVMTEAVNAVLARFFAAHMGESLFSSVMADNPASLKIQGKLGFDVTGVADVYCEARAGMTRSIQTEITFGGYMPD
jgi:RimJ/RimL family protein N-acetyltransferase